MPPTVRAATRADLRIVKTMMREFTEYLNAIADPQEIDGGMLDRIEAHVFGRHAFCGLLLAEADDEPAGYVLHHPSIDMDTLMPALHVIDLFVRQEHRGSGTGRALMEAAADIVRARGGTSLFWTVWDKNPMALGFYRHLGARPFTEEIFMKWSLDEAGVRD